MLAFADLGVESLSISRCPRVNLSFAMKKYLALLLACTLALGATRAQEEPSETAVPPEPSPGEQPSAELIIDAEQAVASEPGVPSPDEPLPQLEGQLPGEQNIFGDDLFGTSELYNPPAQEVPPTPPMIEDQGELERKMRVNFRKLKARIEAAPELAALKEMAGSARTPEDYRAARRSYYALFFDKVRKADASMKDYADTLEKQALAGLYETRIEPTVALNPPPQPQPQEQFIPAKQYPDLLPADEAPVALP
jgi:hypothetical protein